MMRSIVALLSAATIVTGADLSHVIALPAKLPLSFESNQGQTDSRVQFLSRGPGFTLFLTRTGAVMKFGDRTVLRMKLAGSNPKARVEGHERQPGNSNYFIGHDSAQWRTGVPNYAKVRITDVYPGIDLVYYGNQRELEYDWIVKPGADPSRIRLDVDGAEIDLEAAGDLVLKTAAGELRQRKPVLYQEAAGKRQPVEGRWVRHGKRSATFEVAGYDRTRMLVIDPVLVYSTYLGGTGFDRSQGVAVDTTGNTYVTGGTFSTDFPTTNPLRPTNAGDRDVFVTKINADGSARLYSTYFGGTGAEIGFGIAVDGSGNAYVTGNTASSNFPTTTPVQGTNGGGLTDAFVTKFNATGSTALYSTYLGGSGADAGNAIAVDVAGNAYVTGNTDSTNFPLAAPFQATKTGAFPDAFVTKLPSSGSPLIYSSYLGGSDNDSGNGIAVDAVGIAYVTGFTNSPDFPIVAPALQGTHGGGFEDAFVSKISANGAVKLYATFLGGNAADIGHSIALDTGGNAYVTGLTRSTNFPTSNPVQPANGGGADVFVTKLNNAGSNRLYSTYLGGAGDDTGWGIGVDGAGDAYIAGRTDSANFPTANPLQAASGGGVTDAFMTKLNSLGATTLFSTYLGGSGFEQALGIGVDGNGNASVIGIANSDNFPTSNPMQAARAGFDDAFVALVSGNAPTALFRDGAGAIQATSALSTSLVSASGAFVSDPSAAQNAAGATFAVARDASGAIWVNLYTRWRSWGSWSTAGGTMQGVPSVTVIPNGVAYFAARDTSGAYWINTFTDGVGFGGWTSLGGAFVTDPVIAAAPGGSPSQVYVVGKDSFNAIWSAVLLVPGGFSGWQLRGAVSAGKPSVTTGTDNAAYIAIRDPSNSVWMGYQTGNTFNGWQPGGATIATDPQIGAGGGKVYVAALTAAGAVWYNTFNQGGGNNWVGWTNPGGTLSNVAVATGVGPQVFLAGRDGANQLWWYETPGRGWVFVGFPASGSGPLSAAPR